MNLLQILLTEKGIFPENAFFIKWKKPNHQTYPLKENAELQKTSFIQLTQVPSVFYI